MAAAAAAAAAPPPQFYMDEKWKLSKKEGSRRSSFVKNSSGGRSSFTRKCASLVKEQRARNPNPTNRAIAVLLSTDRRRSESITSGFTSGLGYLTSPKKLFSPLLFYPRKMGDSVDLTGDGGVVKKILTRAKPDALQPSDDLPLVDVHYEGVLEETGEVFDTTHEDNTVFSFEIGKGSVIKAWEIAVKTMKVGEVAKITCKPEYAYGIAGSPPDIPPDSTLIFEVELVACRPRKGSSLGSVSDEKARLEELKKQREVAAAVKEEEKKKREEAKAAAAARIQAKLEAKKGHGKGKGKAK
ncbi:hypothetical protein H6P81_007546 [Aristolochia fimbriata]|uniref:peptidylprolyl isomerase n=1 Tax=Aristolochia fimbriata TaxID=158543 RepID=A0AAV7F0P9_ARIFI|nr:hypothetical protein H6P81_007546 [Aristolochia fimbriata]